MRLLKLKWKGLEMEYLSITGEKSRYSKWILMGAIGAVIGLTMWIGDIRIADQILAAVIRQIII